MRVELGDPGAGVRGQHHQPLGLELAQRLADGDAADPHLAGDLLLAQPLAGRVAAADYRLAEAAGDELAAQLDDVPVALRGAGASGAGEGLDRLGLAR